MSAIKFSPFRIPEDPPGVSTPRGCEHVSDIINRATGEIVGAIAKHSDSVDNMFGTAVSYRADSYEITFHAPHSAANGEDLDDLNTIDVSTFANARAALAFARSRSCRLWAEYQQANAEQANAEQNAGTQ